MGGRLVAAGYSHYEISNFALPGHTARHNLRYWRRRTVLAAGPGAHGNGGSARWQNHDDLDAFVRAVSEGALPRAMARVLGSQEEEKEVVMLGPRTRKGVAWADLERCFAHAPDLLPRAHDFLELGLARRSADRFFLTPRGWLLSNELLASLW